MATLLSRYSRGARALLGEHVLASAPDARARVDGLARAMVAHGADAATAQQQALAILERQLQAQASVLAFSRIYLYSGIILVAALPILLLFRTGRGRTDLGPAH